MPIHRLARPAGTAALLVLAAFAFSGCSGSDDAPTPAASASAGGTASATATTGATDAAEDVWSVDSGDLGVSFTADIPDGWATGTADSVPFLRAEDAVDGFQANAYAQFQAPTAGATIETLAADLRAEVEGQDGWTSSQPEGQRTTIGGLPAYMISGLIEDPSAGQLARSATVILAEGTDGPVAVGIIATTSPDDTAGQDAVNAVLGSVEFD